MGAVLASNSSRLSFIDCWRAVAVLLVISAHLSVNHDLKGLSYSSATLRYLISHGQTGVFIFFFISGYVVSRTCLVELNATGNFSIPAFYIRRIFRIAPPLLIYLSVCLALGHMSIINFTTSQFLPAALYVCNNSLVECGWFAGHTWSLAFEEQFYLIFPVTFVFIQTGRWHCRSASIAAILLASIPFIWPVYYIGRTGFVIIYALFILGFVFARNPGAAPKRPLVVTVVFLSAAVVTFLPAGDLFGFLLSGAAAETRVLIGKYYKFIFIVSVPLMVMSTGALGTTLNKFFSNRAISYFGRASYSVYLWQQLATAESLELSSTAQISLLLFAVAGCLLLFEFVEKPLIRLGRNLASSRSEFRAMHVG